MKQNKLCTVLFSVALMFSVVFAAFSFPMGASARVMDENSGTYNGANYNPPKSSDTIKFSVTPGYGHLKVYIKNRGQSNLYVSLKHVASGKVYFENKEIRVGDPALEWKSNKEGFPQGVKAGDFELSFSSGGKAAYLDWAYKSADIIWP